MILAKRKKLTLIIYILCFYAAWTVFVLCIKGNINSQIIKEGVIKTAVWVLPAMLLTYIFRDSVQIGLKEMFVTKVKWRQYIWVYALLAAWVLLGGFFHQGGLSFVIDPDALITVLFVGITEEMVFRGWLLNATVKDMPGWLAVLINAALFLIIHFPRWIQEGIFISTFTSFNFIGIVALSVVFSVSFLKSKNLLVPITMHMLYDLMMFVLLPQVS
ncbi:MAG: CPBP family intramembrane metalloprotease [Oscillospiraceae bacterium]|nr:CPBP family intramembrane metalloprotease [Oscillospiraceae bacterium]